MRPAAFDFERARFNMIEQQIRPWEVLDVQVLQLLGQLKREDFAPPALRALALSDTELPLSRPVVEGECMLAPKVEARVLQDLALQSHERVLEVGTGSGYMAALMSRLCAQVVSLEINPTLAAQARANLERAGIGNVEVRCADAAAASCAACAPAAPFDAIVLSGAVHEVPSALLDLLGPDGRLFAFVGQEPVMRATLVRRSAANSFYTEQPWDIVVPPLRGFASAPRFQF